MESFPCPVSGCDTELKQLHYSHFDNEHQITPDTWIDRNYSHQIVNDYREGYTQKEIANQYPWLSVKRVRDFVRGKERRKTDTLSSELIRQLCENSWMNREEVESLYWDDFRKVKQRFDGTPDNIREKVKQIVASKAGGKLLIDGQEVPSDDVYNEEWLSRTAQFRGIHPGKLECAVSTEANSLIIENNIGDDMKPFARRIAMKKQPISVVESDKVFDRDPTNSKFSVYVNETQRQVRSKMERKVDVALHESDYDYKYEPFVFTTESVRYMPDFVVYNNGVPQAVVEVKGRANKKDKRKAEMFMSTYPNVLYIAVGEELPCDFQLTIYECDHIAKIIEKLST